MSGLADHTTLELECVDRMYLNVYRRSPVPASRAPAVLRRTGKRNW